MIPNCAVLERDRLEEAVDAEVFPRFEPVLSRTLAVLRIQLLKVDLRQKRGSNSLKLSLANKSPDKLVSGKKRETSTSLETTGKVTDGYHAKDFDEDGAAETEDARNRSLIRVKFVIIFVHE